MTDTPMMLGAAKWERSRRRFGLWVGMERIAHIGKEHGRNRWLWSIDISPFTCGRAGSIKQAKDEAVAALKRAMEPQA